MPDEQFNQQQQVIEQAKILERLDNLIVTNTEAHKLILVQTTKTNGTVSDLKSWRDKAQGGFIVINVIVVPVLLWLLYERLKNGI